MFNKKANLDREGITPPRPAAANPQATPERPSASAPESGSAGARPAATVLGRDCKFTGKARVEGTARIDGKLTGEMKATEHLVIGNGGEVNGNLSARSASLGGRFEGKIDAQDRIDLERGSDVQADIHTKTMTMGEGVRFRGNLKVGE